jgi:hypothetical protein
MSALTRRRYPDVPEECWHIYFGDIHAGTITERVGRGGWRQSYSDGRPFEPTAPSPCCRL